MPSPLLRRYSVAVGASNTIIVPAVPTDRSLVIGKLTVASNAANPGGASAYFTISVGGIAIAQNVPMLPGDVYTEGNIVMLAGDTLVAVASAAGLLGCSVFGEEVDNV